MMTDFLVDTNHLSTLATPGHAIPARIQKHIRFGDTFSVPMPVVTETVYGLLGLPNQKENFQRWLDVRVMFQYYEIELSDAEDAAHLQHDLCLNGKQLETVDALIAIIALRYDLILLTTDHDFDAVPGLTIENWYK